MANDILRKMSVCETKANILTTSLYSQDVIRFNGIFSEYFHVLSLKNA